MVRMIATLTAVLLVLPGVAPTDAAPAAGGRVLHVGPHRTLTTPSAAAAVAADGDTVEIDAGTYAGDVATWTQDDLTLRATGGRAHLAAAGASAQGKAIWVIAGDRTRVEDIEFSGASVPDGNGAGIRQEGAGLTVVHCSFHDNQDGILAGANPDSDIEIRRSRFTGNGAGDGLTHNIYVGAVRSLVNPTTRLWVVNKWAPRRARPRYEYRHPTRYVERPRVGRVDLGAFEYAGR